MPAEALLELTPCHPLPSNSRSGRWQRFSHSLASHSRNRRGRRFGPGARIPSRTQVSHEIPGDKSEYERDGRAIWSRLFHHRGPKVEDRCRSARLVATASQNRLSIKRNLYTFPRRRGALRLIGSSIDVPIKDRVAPEDASRPSSSGCRG
jgi:hypothetical protein